MEEVRGRIEAVAKKVALPSYDKTPDAVKVRARGWVCTRVVGFQLQGLGYELVGGCAPGDFRPAVGFLTWPDMG